MVGGFVLDEESVNQLLKASYIYKGLPVDIHYHIFLGTFDCVLFVAQVLAGIVSVALSSIDEEFRATTYSVGLKI